MDRKVALITGITGQDGSYLAELLLAQGYEVHGVLRRHANVGGTQNFDAFFDRLGLHYGDVTDLGSLVQIVTRVRPTELYNLAAQSHVKVSFDVPEYTSQTDAIGFLNVLEAVRITGVPCRVYQASTSEMFGDVCETPQTESTPFRPCSPYACAKVYAHSLCSVYRASYGMYVVSGILFNHESPRRGVNFVTRKVTRHVARYAAGSPPLELGNLNAVRDWGHARDYVRGMWRMMQQPEPRDYVLATGQSRTIRELVETAFAVIGIQVQWHGHGVHEVGVCARTGSVLVKVAARYYRPNEVHTLCGDSTRARRDLGWEPTVTFEDLIREMVEADTDPVQLGNGGQQ